MLDELLFEGEGVLEYLDKELFKVGEESKYSFILALERFKCDLDMFNTKVVLGLRLIRAFPQLGQQSL